VSHFFILPISYGMFFDHVAIDRKVENHPENKDY
jgi:hypothetical protein